jgi:hypothetical protein
MPGAATGDAAAAVGPTQAQRVHATGVTRDGLGFGRAATTVAGESRGTDGPVGPAAAEPARGGAHARTLLVSNTRARPFRFARRRVSEGGGAKRRAERTSRSDGAAGAIK